MCHISACGPYGYLGRRVRWMNIPSHEMWTWPDEVWIRLLIQFCLGAPIIPTFTNSSALNHALNNAEQTLQPSANSSRALSISRALAVAEFHPGLNFLASDINLTPDILAFAQTAGSEPPPSEGFEEWLTQAWATPVAPTPTARASANTSGKTSGVSSRSSSSQKSKRTTPQ